jgi:hypothetical protein
VADVSDEIVEKFQESLEALDLQGILVLMNVLAQRALFLQMNPPKKSKIQKPSLELIKP